MELKGNLNGKVSLDFTGDDDIALITLDNPKVNALSSHMRELLLHALSNVETYLLHSNKPKVAVISGSGRGFSAGADLREILETIETGNPEELRKFVKEGHELVNRVAHFPIPIVAVLHGFALGGGKELALASHWRIAVDGYGLKMGFPEILLGFIPGWGGTVRTLPLLKRRGGHALLLKMLAGGNFDAQEALKAGLLHNVVDSFESAIALIENEIRRGDKVLLRKADTSVDPKKALAEQELFVKLAMLPETTKRIRAFLEKR